MRRALQRNTELRRAPGALYARLLLRALGAEEVAEREARRRSARPKPSNRAPGHAHLREHALGMRSARAATASRGSSDALFAQPQHLAQTGPDEQPDESTAATN